MLSRVADSLFWLGRYIERAENYARFIEVNLNLSLDLPPGINEQWKPLVLATGGQSLFEQSQDSYVKEEVIHFLAFDKENPFSMLRSIELARENSRIIRENISREAWETLNGIYYYMKNATTRKVWLKEDPRDFFNTIRARIHALNGLAYSAESRTEGWYFNQMGQYIERADKTSRILDVKYHTLLPSVDEIGTPLDYLHWAALLRSVGAFNAHRRVYGKITGQSVLEFLLLNKYFPRSVFFCLLTFENCLQEITGKHRGYRNLLEKTIGALRSELEFTDKETIASYGVHEYIDQLQIKINNISDIISDQYFGNKSNFASELTNEE
ncbi:MAG: alpha-E domain-containing protein [Cyclobacteriaceae bacterium]